MSVEKPLRELSIGEIIGQSFSLYRVKFFQFFAVCMVGGLAIDALTMGVELIFPIPPPPAEFPEVSVEALFEYLGGLFPPLVVILVSTMIAFWIVNDVIIDGIVTKYSSDLLEKGDSNLRESLSYMKYRFPSLLVAMWIVDTLIIDGLIFFVVPGILFLIILSLVPQLIMIEGMGALESLARSRRLVSKRWGKAFALIVIVLFMLFGVGWLASAALAIPAMITGAPFVIGFPPPDPVHGIIATAVMSLIRPIVTIAFVFFYYSMNAREAK